MSHPIRIDMRFALVAVCLCATVPSLFAQECPEPIGHLPGLEVSAVASEGDYAYYGSHNELLIADVSDPSAPSVVGWVELPAGEVTAVAVSMGYAYVVWWGEYERGGLRVFDVSTPRRPLEVASMEGGPGQCERDIAVDGDYAYLVGGGWWCGGGLGGGPGYLRVIDVSSPSDPVDAGFLRLEYQGPIRTPTAVAVSGNQAYVVDFTVSAYRLCKIDVSSPSQPHEVDFRFVPGAADVDVSGGHAFVASSDGLQIVDVSSFNLVGHFSTSAEAFAVSTSDDRAFLAGADGFRVIEVSSPATPVELGFLAVPAYAVAVTDRYAYVAIGSSPGSGGGGALRVIDVGIPGEPIELGGIAPYFAFDVAAMDGYAYVSSGGLIVFDVITPSSPTEVGHLDGIAGPVEVGEGYVYVVDGGLRVIDVSLPSSPVEVGFLETPAYSAAIAVDGDYAYVTASDLYGSPSLRVIDIRTPSSPTEVGHLDGIAGPVEVGEGYLYVVDGGLHVIDVSLPSSPVEVGFLEGDYRGIATSGSYAYVAEAWAEPGGFRVIDVSIPSAPTAVGVVDLPYLDEADLTVSRAYVYVAAARYLPQEGEYEQSLRVIDVSNPTAPVEVGAYETMGNWDLRLLGVAASDSSVFFAAADKGLYIFNECTRGPSPNAQACLVPAAAVAAGAEGAFFRTDLELNNAGAEEAQVVLQWLPRGEDNSEPMESEPFTLAPGASLRFENVLTEVFGLEPDSLGALKLVASTDSVIGMSRTYNIPGGKAAGSFGQGLPAIRETDMLMGTAPQRILFLSENEDFRANVGCVNGTDEDLTISIGIFDDEGLLLDTRTMELGPYANDQLNQVLGDWAPINGYVDVWVDRDDALYTCYGSMLDNQTSDPTTILPQVPSGDTIHVPAAALAAGAEGAFFTTDLDLNNAGSTDLTYELVWLPRGDDNSDPTRSDTFSLAAGSGVRYADVLGEVFGLEPDEVGALSIEANGPDLLAMSRTYNTPLVSGAGTFGQGLAGIAADQMIPTGVTKRILFLSENDDVRSNLGCINGVGTEVVVAIDLFDSDGAKLETKYMMLPPHSNRQINGVFQDYAPINGYVDVRTYTPEASIYCYGSVLDNVTSDPTTVLPQ